MTEELDSLKALRAIDRRRFLGLAGAAGILGVAGCSGVKEKEVGWRPLEGTRYSTTYWGLPFYWVGPGGAYGTPQEVGDAIDKAYVEWMDYYKQRWADMEEWELRFATYNQNIQLFTGGAVRGDSTDFDVDTLGIWWWEHNQIDVAMDAPYHWDGAMSIYTQGVEVLKHEWSHCARWKRGDTWFHP